MSFQKYWSSHREFLKTINREEDPFYHWLARRLPLRLVRAVIVLAARQTRSVQSIKLSSKNERKHPENRTWPVVTAKDMLEQLGWPKEK